MKLQHFKNMKRIVNKFYYLKRRKRLIFHKKFVLIAFTWFNKIRRMASYNCWEGQNVDFTLSL